MSESLQSLQSAQEMPWATLLVALGFEFLLGEPPSRLHPVVWMGATTSRLMFLAPTRGPARQLLFGAFVALLVPILFTAGAYLLDAVSTPWTVVHVGLSGVLLSTTFSIRALERAAHDMSEVLRKPVLEDVDRGLLRSLCSRDPSKLNKEQLAAATIESVAENSSDSFVAPLFYFALFGLPGAVFYRAVNTLDAMIGYHGRFEYLGKPVARLDDLLNWIPSRACALLLMLAGALMGLPSRRGWKIAWRDHGKTESPNAGWPMATMAGLLGVRLTKAEHYVLGDPSTEITSAQIDTSCRVARSCFYLSVVTMMGLQALTHIGWGP